MDIGDIQEVIKMGENMSLFLAVGAIAVVVAFLLGLLLTSALSACPNPETQQTEGFMVVYQKMLNERNFEALVSCEDGVMCYRTTMGTGVAISCIESQSITDKYCSEGRLV